MILFQNARVRVWHVYTNGKFPRASISSSEKNQSGDRIYSNWNASFVGKAAEKAKDLKENSNIIIKSGKLSTSTVEKDGKKTIYTNMTIFDYEYDDGSVKKPEEVADVDEIPWE